MTVNPCNCLNKCPHKGERVGTMSWSCKIRDPPYYLTNGSDIDLIKLVGCLSHPLARLELNKKVIEKLKRSKQEATDEGMLGFRALHIYDEAIELLKEGVPKRP